MWSRFFAPWAGITEDPVTGSLYAILGPYWSKRLPARDRDTGSPQHDQVCISAWPVLDLADGQVRPSGQMALCIQAVCALPRSEEAKKHTLMQEPTAFAMRSRVPQVTAVPHLLCLRLAVHPWTRSTVDNRCWS